MTLRGFDLTIDLLLHSLTFTLLLSLAIETPKVSTHPIPASVLEFHQMRFVSLYPTKCAEPKCFDPTAPIMGQTSLSFLLLKLLESYTKRYLK